ncbi:MAG: hypothetical protein JWO69_1836, partial [Thermoleophilia bacterium]|nr:hypothetical protein [Thermoleophilia bacterium]
NRNGDAPTLWVTPYQPDAVRFLPAAFEQRDAAFRAVVRELDADPALHFTFLDLADLEAFGGTRLDFYDGIHMTESNTARVIAELDRRTQLRRGDTRLPTD